MRTGVLTERQAQVLELLADGASTVGIATELYLSVETVRWHVKSILRALGVHSRAEAVALVRGPGANRCLRCGSPLDHEPPAPETARAPDPGGPTHVAARTDPQLPSSRRRGEIHSATASARAQTNATNP